MGWDVYLLPVVLILIGGWMLLRNMDKLPNSPLNASLGSSWFSSILLPGSTSSLMATSLKPLKALAAVTSALSSRSLLSAPWVNLVR